MRLLHGADHFQNRIAFAVATVEASVAAGPTEEFVGGDVRERQIRHMDKIPYTGAVRRVVVSSVDRQALALTSGNFASDFDELRRIRGALSRSSLRIGSRHVEIAQDAVVKTRGCGNIPDHALHEELGPSIRVDWIEQ